MINKRAGLIACFLLISLILFLGTYTFSEDGDDPPQDSMSEVETLEEMLKDDTIPPEMRQEIERIIKDGPPEEAAGDTDLFSDEIMLPAEDVESDMSEEDLSAQDEPLRSVGTVPIPASKAPKQEVSSLAKNKISLDLKGVDIIDVLKMLSARSNLNIVAGKNVRGKVTLFLKDVDIWDAFEIILASNDLAYEKREDIINVMTERDYEQLYGERYSDKKKVKIFRLEYAKVADVAKALNQTKSKIGKIVVDEPSNTIVIIDAPQPIKQMEKIIAKMDMPTETKIFSLNYAKAEDIKTKITDILTKGVGAIQVDERTNKIVVTDLVIKMPDIVNVIAAMDEKHKVVLIEAKIIEIELTDEFRYGVDWGRFFKNIANTSLDFNFADLGDVSTGLVTGSSITIGKLAHASLDGAIRALTTVGKTNVISSPRITVLNNEEAKVLIGTNQPYVTSTTTVPSAGSPVTSESVTYIDVGITLRVTPTINNDGFVTMKIKPEISSLGTPIETAHAAGATGNQIPVVSKSETDTTVMVKDGTTILIAGLIQDRDIETIDKVPILGDIPIIGYAFKSQSKGSTSSTSNQPEKKEIVIFLTPYIMDGTESFPEAANTFYGDRVTQRKLMEEQITHAVEGIKRQQLVGDMPEEKKIDTNTHISKDLNWFGKRGEGIGVEEKPKKEPAFKQKEEGKKGDTVIPPTNLIMPMMGGYYSYYENLRNKIFWMAKDNYPEVPEKGEKDVRLLFTLTDNGKLKGEPQVLNEVDAKLAAAAKEAVKNASPFPPFPRTMEKREAAFRVTISYE
ncbi:MAG: secretin N-terminal domain-containing protein [Candidatus Omnitrophota bacterium]